MKQSNKILLGGFISVIGIVFLFILYFSINSTGDKNYQAGVEWDGGELTFSDDSDYRILDNEELTFTQVKLTGSWNVTIKQGEERSVYINNGTSSPLKNVDIDLTDEKLEIRHKNIQKGEFAEMKNNHVKLVITTPELNSLEFGGAGNIQYTGFKEGSLKAIIEGAINLVGNDFKLDTLELNLQGMGNVNFTDGTLKTFDVNSGMLGNIEAKLKDGEVRGHVDGMGAVTLYGSIKNNSLTTSGMVSLEIE